MDGTNTQVKPAEGGGVFTGRAGITLGSLATTVWLVRFVVLPQHAVHGADVGNSRPPSHV